MTILELIARLTLEDGKYKAALEKAEEAADKFDGDVEVTIGAKDEVTPAIAKAEKAVAAAEKKGSLDANGTVSATEEVTSAVSAAESAVKEADEKKKLDITGKILTTDNFTPGLQKAIAQIHSADEAKALNAKGELTITVNDFMTGLNSAIAAVFKAETDGSLDTKGEILATDFYTGVLNNLTSWISTQEKAGKLDSEGDAYVHVNEALANIQSVIDSAVDADGKTFTLKGSAEVEPNDLPELEEDLSGVSEEATEWEQVMNGALQGIYDGFKAFAIDKMVIAIWNSLRDAVDYAKSLGVSVDQSATSLNASTHFVQKWGYALKSVGMDISDIEEGYRTIVDYLGSDGEVSILQQLGLDQKNFASAEELFDSVMNRLAELENPSERATLIEQLFGKKSIDGLMNLLAKGESGIQDLFDTANQKGLILSDEEIEKAVNYQDALDRIEDAVNSIKTSVGMTLLPIFTEVAGIVASVTDGIAFMVALLTGRPLQGTKFDEITQVFLDQDAAIEDANEEAAKANLIVARMDLLTEKFGDAAQNTQEWKDALNELTAIFPELKDNIDQETGALQLTNQEIRAYIENQRQAAIEQAKQNALQALRDQLYEATVSLGTAQGTEQTNREMMKAAEKSLIDIAKKTNPNFTGEGMSYDQLLFAAQSAANEYQYNTGDNSYQTQVAQIEEIYKGYAKAAEEAVKVQSEMSGKIAQLELQLQLAEEALARLSESDETEANVDSNAEETSEAIEGVGDSLEDINGDSATVTVYENHVVGYTDGEGVHNAKGLDYVPYNGYSALLHKGEAVLSGNEAREWRDNGGRGQGYGDAGAIVAAIQSLGNDVASMKLYVGERAFGGVVVDYGGRGMNEYIGSSSRRRRRGYGRT